ncbi:MAG TPA: MFS transporter [Dissulfurispiraceae bacterium]|nr:MFS transporter [Dissulfurispiraceae bacterium]
MKSELGPSERIVFHSPALFLPYAIIVHMIDSSIAASARKKAYINIVLPLFISSVIAYLDRINIGYAALTMNKDLGFSAQIFGMGAGIFFAGYIIFEVPGALIAERFSPRLWLARIMVSWGAVSGLMAFISTPMQFYIVRFLLGAAEASLYPVIYASCIPRWFGPKDRARAIALLLTSLQFSGIVGAPLAGWLIDVPFFGLRGWQGLFIIEAIPAIIFGFVLVYWMADWPEQAKWLTKEEKSFLSEQYKKEVELKKSVRHYSVREALCNPEVLKLCLAYFLWITGFWGFNYWMPTVLKSVSGWSNFAIGWLIVVPMSLSLVTMLALGHSSSKTGERRWHGAIGLFIAAAGLGIGAFMKDPWISFFFVILAGIGVYAPFGVWWSYPTTFLSGTAAAGAVGLINSCGNVGGFVGPYITGFIKDLTGSFAGAWVYLAVSLLLGGLLILTFRKQPTDQSQAGNTRITS